MIRNRGPHQFQVVIIRIGFPKVRQTFSTEREAKAFEAKTVADMDAGTHVSRKLAKKTTLADHISAYIENVTELRPGKSSVASEKSRLQRFLNEEKALCAHSLANLTSAMFEDYRNRRLKQFATRGKEGGRGRYKPQADFQPKRRKDGEKRKNAAEAKAPPKPLRPIAPGTVKKELDTLMRVLDYRKFETGLAINPLDPDRVKRPVVKDERWSRLAPELVRKVIEECYSDKTRNRFLGPIVEFALETGQRRGSLLNLKWSDIDFTERSAHIREAKTSRSPENPRSYKIGLTKAALKILDALPRGPSNDGPVFPMSSDALKGAFERARKRAEVEFFRFHDTRHERAASLIEAGMSDTAVMTQIGFQDPKTLKRYANLRPSWLADELDKISVLSVLENQKELRARLEREIARATAELEALKQAE
ncbi:tyrosine-type recombinase/integrase [Dongia sp.]|uniref:tyrosine-type recombinase/integrase n=1 Tax=Dongia sp. TaxID=1977262 RepID=UPI0035B1E2A6